MCHNAWQRHACVTHGMPCVTMHGLFKAYIYGVSKIRLLRGEGQQEAVCGSSKEKEEEGKRGREERRREREKMKGEREERGGKGKKKREEKKGRKRGKRKRKRKECCAVSRLGWQRTRNYATRERFPHTLVILCLVAVYWPTCFVRFSGRICMLCGFLVIV